MRGSMPVLIENKVRKEYKEKGQKRASTLRAPVPKHKKINYENNFYNHRHFVIKL